MSRWSKVRQILEQDLLCNSLKGRVRYFTTRYKSGHGRICILVDEKEMLNMPFETEYEVSFEVYKRKDNTKHLSDWYDEVEKEFRDKGIFEPIDFKRALNIYFTKNIEDSLNSDDHLVRLLAIFDRRVGKRTLKKLSTTINDLPEWLQCFYKLRFESENISIP